MNFHTTSIVKYIVLAVCLLFLAFVIWKLYRDNLGVTAEDGIYWPPEINRCPDYWTYKSDGLCHNDNFDYTIEPLVGPVEALDLEARCIEVSKQTELPDVIPWEGIDNLC